MPETTRRGVAAALTQPASSVWPPTSGYRRSIRSAVVRSHEPWDALADRLLRWGVKTASGFVVAPADPVAVGARPVITVRVVGVLVREPVEVVAVVRTPARCGFAYRTLPGHPVDGEEAFVLDREDGRVRLTVRSLTRPARSGAWRALFPALLVAQAAAHRRYLRALDTP